MDCKNTEYRKANIVNNITIFKNFLPKIFYELDKHLPYSLQSI